MSDVAIRVENLGKRYHLGSQERYYALRDTITDALKAPWRAARSLFGGDNRGNKSLDTDKTFWALRDVSFEVERGEVLSIIGRNGSGKSTLLKILSRVTEPTVGEAIINGRVGSLLEVGTGFHPELTGRENIFLSGTILGMGRAEIKQQFDEIVEFAEIDQFLDTPVKRYSSGMHVRLGFAIAAHLSPEVLIIDEVLAVGDAAFQKKCLGKVGDVARSGRTVLFVSHNMAAVSAFSHKAMLLEAGRIVNSGEVSAVVQDYLAQVAALPEIDLCDRQDRQGNGRIRFTRVRALGDGAGGVASGRPMRFALEYESKDPAPIRHLDVTITLLNETDQKLISLATLYCDGPFDQTPSSGELICELPYFPLAAGVYRAHLWSAVAGVVADHVLDALKFRVDDGDAYANGRAPVAQKHGPVLSPHRWRAAKAA